VSSVPTWKLFAYIDDNPELVESRLLADWQLEDALRWCQTRGYDRIYLSRVSETRFTRARPAKSNFAQHT
jgi:hypothetical protein